MRQFQECQTTERGMTKVICNCCGKEIDVKNGIPREDFLTVEKQWGYFSGKDGETHRFELCEECYDRLTASFRIPVETEEK